MTRGQNILVVDDDLTIAGALADELTRNGMSVTQVSSAEAAALALSRSRRFDAIIMEARLPDADGCEFCARLRRSGMHLPILMLSREVGVGDIVRGLEAGANDYLTKPYRIASLLARLRAHSRAYQTNSFAMLSVGPLHFNPGKRLLFDPVAGRPKRLTAKEAALFGVLYRAKEKPVDRNQLMRDVWGDQPDLQSHAVEAMIYRLRQKIEPRPSRPAFLLKVPEGYRLVDPSRAAGAASTPPKNKPRLAPGASLPADANGKSPERSDAYS